MKIHISESTKSLIENCPYQITERGKVEIKGKGEMKTYFVLSKLDKHGKPIKLSFEMIASKSTVENNIEKPVEEERGYSPVTMEDVRKSRASLRKMVDEAFDEPEPIKLKNASESVSSKQPNVNHLNSNEIDGKKVNSDNNDQPKRNSVVRRSSVISNPSGKPPATKDKSGNESIIISYSSKTKNESPKSINKNKSVQQDNQNDPKRKSSNGVSQMTGNNGINNNALKSMKTQTCQLL